MLGLLAAIALLYESHQIRVHREIVSMRAEFAKLEVKQKSLAQALTDQDIVTYIADKKPELERMLAGIFENAGPQCRKHQLAGKTGKQQTVTAIFVALYQ